MALRISLSILALPALLAACASPQAQQRAAMAIMAEQVLARAGSIGDPGRVAAADFAFARMARDEGTWTAFRHYAAPGAVMDAPGGYAPVTEVLAGLADPAEPIRWEPTNVWSSCDGSLAVSLGRFLRSNGLVGDYVTLWELQPDNSYKWIYDTGTPDDPQPIPEPEPEVPDDAIVVEGIPSIEGRVADCLDPGMALASASTSFEEGVVGHEQAAKDATLAYRREYRPDGSRQVVVEWWRDGSWSEIVELTIPAGQ